MPKKHKRLPSLLILLLISLLLSGIKVNAQESGSDSLFAARLMEDNLVLFNQADSLERMTHQLEKKNLVLQHEIDSLKREYRKLVSNHNLQSRQDSTKKDQSQEYSSQADKQKIAELSEQLGQKIENLTKAEAQLASTEEELKDLKSSSALDQVKLEGKLDAHNSQLAGKDKEIVYLKKSVEEKNQLLKEKTNEISSLNKEKDRSLITIDTLNKSLNQKALEYAKTSERLSLIEPEYNVLKAEKDAANSKKKKIRFIQGMAIKSYRTPDWQMAPASSSSPNDYVITNKNAGKVDFDYITGISLSVYDLTQEDSKFTSDVGVFAGFGGQNLFKNFYLGPSFKFFDFIHLNTGLNFAEYEQLKPGFKEGDHPGASGLSSILIKKWKTNFFIGFTLDLELLRIITRKNG
ncbi:MAG: hypothetical protein HXX13_09705 [Bacteroidetes bacterium]|nr:hypothetical protein [Bacteroidota bacterium]